VQLESPPVYQGAKSSYFSLEWVGLTLVSDGGFSTDLLDFLDDVV
jgi:hypothetical protein